MMENEVSSELGAMELLEQAGTDEQTTLALRSALRVGAIMDFRPDMGIYTPKDSYALLPPGDPLATVQAYYDLPITPYVYQEDVIQFYGKLPFSGMYLEVGLGKTLCATVIALYKYITDGRKTIVLMPPILLIGWQRWLNKIRDRKTGKPLRSVIYDGSPQRRKDMALTEDFILMSYDIFKRDREQLVAKIGLCRLTVVADEATALKNVESKNYQNFRDLFGRDELDRLDAHVLLLTGTPLTTPLDAYAYIRLTQGNSSGYPSRRMFEACHVTAYDFYDRPEEWANLPLLHKRFMTNACRGVARELRSDLPEVTYTSLDYELHPKHRKLYQKLAEEQLLPLADRVIDATNASRLFHNLQQIILNPVWFSDDPSIPCMGFDLLDEVLEELNGRPLVVVAHYQRSIQGILEHTKQLGSMALYGLASDKDKQRAIDKFSEGKLPLLVIQPQSGGLGVDGLQFAGSDMLFLESPLIPKDFTQVVGRLDRDGQTRPVNVRTAVALGTIQVRLRDALLDKDELVNRVQGSYQNLRDMIFGD